MQLPPVVPHLHQRGEKPCRHLHPQERYTTLRDGQEVGHDGGCGEAQAAQGHRGGRCLRRARGRHRGAGAARRARHLAGNGGRAGSARSDGEPPPAHDGRARGGDGGAAAEGRGEAGERGVRGGDQDQGGDGDPYPARRRHCVRVGDTRRPQGLFGSTVAAKAVVAAADLERTILYGEIVFSESGEWVVPDPPPEEWREYEPAISRDWSLPEAFEVNMVHYKFAIRRLLKAFPALQAASPPTVRPCVCSAGARRWPWELDIYPPTEAWCSAACGDIRRGQELWRDAWIEADTSRWGGDAEDDLWGEYNPLRLGETEMEVLRCALARCRKKSGV
mmetsp:Transcript_28539/g.91822  ORF Transcript_28539/g.91822 Transcript_28539/m.91822 type:complete len:333 (-) Transcript_28539:886-1884(-)